ncbi:MAG: hypothetical protein QGF59_16680 [Pirellulaceae bacterium]|nr:hypothetical protein [Pirellulaceae bacterium]
MAQPRQYLLEFVSRNHVPFWAMEPHDELAEIRKIRDSGNEQKHQDVFTFARPGEEYVCYVLGDGPATVAVQLPDGVYTVRWYDPKSGRFLSPTSSATGGDRRRLSSPDFEQDIVLHIRASG